MKARELPDGFNDFLNQELIKPLCVEKGIHSIERKTLEKDLHEKGYSVCERCGVILKLQYNNGKFELIELKT